MGLRHEGGTRAAGRSRCRIACGGEVVEDEGLGWGDWLGGVGWEVRGVAADLFEEELGEGAGLVALAVREDLGGGGDGAEVGVGDDLFDEAGVGLGFGGGGLGEIERGDLEAVEEEAGAAWVELVGGEAVEDLADGVLDGRAVFKRGEGEGGLLVLALGEVYGLGSTGGVGGAATAGVVVVAELLVAEAGAAAAVAIGEDVAALEAAGLGGVFGRWHG